MASVRGCEKSVCRFIVIDSYPASCVHRECALLRADFSPQCANRVERLGALAQYLGYGCKQSLGIEWLDEPAVGSRGFALLLALGR
jgi:hypothetical protein